MFQWLSFENPVAIWWMALSTAGVLNILFWIWTRVYRFSDVSIKILFQQPTNRQNVIWYSMFYVFVCAFRSWFPRADVQRICVWDTWLSSVFLGRSVATVAELAFVFQWSLVLGFYGSEVKDSMVTRISKIIFPVILVAEICSWYAVITTHYLGNAIEESLWALTYSMILISLIQLQKKLVGALKLAAQFAVGGCALYVLFMVTVDVPMYLHRLGLDRVSQKPHLGFWEGLVDLNQRWIVTHSIADWKSEIPWQTLYFTAAVLVSIALCYVPLERKSVQRHLKGK